MKKLIIVSLFLLAGHRASGQLAVAGENTILTNSPEPILVNGPSTAPANPVDISNNWWGHHPPPLGWNNNYVSGTNFTSGSTFLSSKPSRPFFDCGSLFDLAGRKGNVPQSLQDANDSPCSYALGASEGLVTDGLYDQAYDSACYYLSHCYYQANATEGFGALASAGVDTIETQIGCTSLRSFLLSVLPLRSDDDWFCHCVLDLSGTFFEDTNSNREYMSLLYWLMNNPRCAAYQAGIAASYYQERKDDYHLWQDTMHYPEKYDSSLLTMQQMGLDSVLIIAATEGVTYQPGASQIILDAHITSNPFTNETNVSLLIGREAYIHIGVYNLLGEQIAGAGYNGTFEQGSAIVPMNLDASPQGIYYVRIQTANNETETLKLVKE